MANQLEQLSVKPSEQKTSHQPKPTPAQGKKEVVDKPVEKTAGVLQVNSGLVLRKDKESQKPVVVKDFSFSEFEVADPTDLDKVTKTKLSGQNSNTKKNSDKPQQPKKRANRKETNTGENTPESVDSPAPERKAPKQREPRKEKKEVEVSAVLIEQPKKSTRKSNPKPKMAIPTEEFDFESANAKFIKPEEENEVEVSEVYYSKKSFFDDISNDVKDRENSGKYFLFM
jgi:hypothetical protein